VGKDERRGWALGHYGPLALGAAVLALIVVLAPSDVPAGNANISRGGSLIPASDLPGTPGVTVGGVHCGPGVRQVPWSAYAPLCQPAWHGNNGGATAPGVTATTITITYRSAIPPALIQLARTVAPGTFPTVGQALTAMNAYIRIFNRTFELYGRHVVLKVFQGVGNAENELLGTGEREAQADAAEAKSLGAFADVSLISSTLPYDTALAEHHVISIGASFATTQWFDENAPYAYSVGPTCDETASAAASVIGRSMAGLPAIFAGSASMRSETRRFGVVAPDVPMYQQCVAYALNALAHRYHVAVARNIAYALDFSQFQSEATNIVAQLKAAGVTTVLCACDPLLPIWLTSQADAQGYHPEWFTLDWGDAFGRFPLQDQWSHALAGGIASVPRIEQEAYRVFELAHPHGHAAWLPVYASIYSSLLLLFDGLQAAGPDLTPFTFEQGFFSLPPSVPGGELGSWQFGEGVFAPQADFQILWWDPSAVSNDDGRLGAWVPCNGGAFYAFADHASSLPAHEQLRCFGS
jgi:hypothetical protein